MSDLVPLLRLHRPRRMMLCGLWLLAATLLGQPSMRFDAIGRNEGLSQSAVMCMVQDRDGYIWFGTEDGLNRYDGYDFLVFKAGGSAVNGLHGDYISALVNGPDGNIWVGTRSGGLYRYVHKTGELQLIPLPGDASVSPEIQAMTFDQRGHLWLGTSAGLIRTNIETGETVHFASGPDIQSLSDDRIQALAQDDDGNLWVGTHHGLNRMNPETGTVRRFMNEPDALDCIPSNQIFSLLPTAKGTWVGTANGLCFFPRNSETCTRIALEEPGTVEQVCFETQALALGRDEVLWIGTNAGLVRYDLRTRHFFRYRQNEGDPNSLGHDQVRCLFEDEEGVLFVGTWGGSVSRYDRNREKFGLVQHRPNDPLSLSTNHMWCFLETRDRTLWVGTEGGGLCKRDPNTGQFTTYTYKPGVKTSISSTNIHAMCLGESDELWLGSFSGIDIFDKRSEQVIAHFENELDQPSSLSDNNIWCILRDHQGTIWVGTQHGGLNRFIRESKRFERFVNDPEQADSLAHNWVMTMTEDSKGQLWVGSFGGGVNLFNPETSRFKIFAHEPQNPKSLSNNNISCILEAGDGSGLWIATFGGGLNFLNTLSGEAVTYGTTEGMPDDNLYGVLADQRGTLWISSNNGLLAFEPKSGKKTIYTVSDGLQDNEFNSGAFFRGPSGKLYFGGLKGYNGFDPLDLLQHSSPPKLAITGFLRNNKMTLPRALDPKSPLLQPIEQTQQLDLTYHDKVVALRFAALAYANPKKNQYAYKLEGFDDTWIETDAANRLATFTALDPGTYIFRVKAANADGVWNEIGTSMILSVSPPPWDTWWARGLMLLALGFGVYLYVSGQRRRLERARDLNERLTQVDRLRDDFLANTSHELRTPLNGIVGLAESLIEGAQGNLPEGLNRNLKMIASSGRRLKALVDDILDFSKIKHDSLSLNRSPVSLHPLVDIVYTMSAPLLRDKQVRLINEIAEDLPAALADENRLQQVFYNIIGNAVRFTDHGYVKTRAWLVDELLHIEISDSGIGIPFENQEKVFESFVQAQNNDNRGGTGLGLALTRRLVEMHGGTIALSSEPGVGTRVEFTLPSTPERPHPKHLTISSLTRFESLAETEEVVQKESAKELLPVGGAEFFHLLIVDDEPINLQVLVNHLQAYPCKVTTARSGREAIELLEQLGDVDLVLLDIMMPGLSGYETCRLIRNHGCYDHLPVIFLTARNQVGDLVQAFETGANDYLTKPVTRAELLARVGLHLQQMVQQRTLSALNREQESLNHIVMEINRETDLEQLLDTMLEQGLNHFPAGEAATILLWSEEKAVFQVAASRGYDQLKLQQLTFTREELLARYVGQGKAFEEDVNRVTQIRSIVPMEKLKGFETPSCMLVMPLAPNGQLDGFLVLDNFHDPDAFDEADVRKLNRFREHAVMALAKLRLVQLLSRKNQAIVAAQEKLVLQEKMASIGFLAAGISHEVKNPTSFMLISIQNLITDLKKFHDFIFELIEGESDPEIDQAIRKRFENLGEQAAIVHEGATRVGTIVRDLGSFARQDEEHQIADLAANLTSTAHLVQSNFKQDVDLRCELTEPILVKCNPSQLNQVFMNLMINACQAIISGQDPSKAQRGSLEITAEQSEDTWMLRFQDNGPGIPPNNLERIFEPFYTTKSSGEGTGLGLAISRNIVHEHGGRLEVKSQEGKGSTFTLQLPKSRGK